ncbi:MAG: dephospho-CoA kinase [Fidelibacterota bacterium]
MLTLGVTGGLGSGKSTVCHFFEQLGAEIFDADKEAKKILFSDDRVREKLVRQFGSVILKNQEIDKAALSKIVFHNHENQQFLNKTLHPLVTESFLRKKNAVTKDLYIMDAALLFEAKLQQHFDKTLLIYADRDIRMKRALQRGNLSKHQIIDRMNLQMSEENKKKLADIVITNNGSIRELKNKITVLYKNLV